MSFLVFTMKSHQQIVTLAVFLILCEINFIIGASFTTEKSEEDCPKNIEFECQQKDLYCCAKTGNQCCSEEDYFDQVSNIFLGCVVLRAASADIIYCMSSGRQSSGNHQEVIRIILDKMPRINKYT